MSFPDLSDTKNHRDAIARLVTEMGWTRGAELGVGSGHLSRLLLDSCPGLHLIGVDLLRHPYRARIVRGLAREYRGRYTLLAMATKRAAEKVADGSLDFIFIDAGHGYTAVHDDIHRWHRKVHSGGWILGHDYGHPKYPGVARAVNRWFGTRVIVLDHTIWAVPGHALAGPVSISA